MTYPKNRRGLQLVRVGLLTLLLTSLLLGCGGAASGRGSATPEQASNELRNNAQLIERGRVAMRRGDSIRAEHYFSLAIENGYNKSDILPELLTVCLSSSRLRSALNYAEPFLRQHPKDARLRYLVATVYVGLGQTAVAKQELETVLRHEPSFAAAYFLLAMLELPTDESRAKAHWERYLALQPTGDKATEARERLEALDAASRTVRVSADRQQSWENTLTTSLEETTTRGEQL